MQLGLKRVYDVINWCCEILSVSVNKKILMVFKILKIFTRMKKREKMGIGKFFYINFRQHDGVALDFKANR